MAESGVDVSIERKDEPAPADGKRHPNTCPPAAPTTGTKSCARRSASAVSATPLPDAGARADRLPRRPGSFEEEAADVRSADPLEFFDLRPYRERLAEAELQTGSARRSSSAGRRSTGTTASSRSWTSRSSAARWAAPSARSSSARARAPPSDRCRSSPSRRRGRAHAGGILSLMQLPKTVCAVEDLHEAGGALISVMAHPTTAGVLASFASLGDVIVAEPKALLSFTGLASCQNDAGKLPTTSASPSRTTATGTWTRSCRVPSCARTWRACCGCSRASRVTADEQLRLRERLAKLRRLSLLGGTRVSGDLERLEEQLERMEAEVTDEEIWRSVELARHPTGRTRSTTSSGCWTTSSSCTATGGGRTTRRSSPASAASAAARSRSSATRRAATSRSAPSGTSAWPTRRATGRRCA